MANPTAVRDVLRDGRSSSLARRRRIAGLAALGLVDFAVISLYQMGAIRRLPDPPGKLFDSNKVNASKTAYKFGIPDGTTGAVMYAGIMVLAAAGGTRATGRRKLLDYLLAGAVSVGALAAAQYLVDMTFRQKKACVYCLMGAAVNAAMVPPALRELRA